MNFKTTYILFGLLGILLATVGLMQWLGGPPADKTRVMPEMQQAKIKSDDIDVLEIDRSTASKPEKLVFIRDRANQRWQLIEPGQYRVDVAPVNRIVQEIIDARQEESFDRSSDLKQYDLDPPATVITLTKRGDGGEQQWKLNVGRQSVVGDKAVGDKAVVYVANAARPKEAMAVPRTRWRGSSRKARKRSTEVSTTSAPRTCSPRACSTSRRPSNT